MSEWTWVLTGFAITYASITGYLISLRLRHTRARHRLKAAS